MAVVWNKTKTFPKADQSNREHILRVQNELRRAGATIYDIAKFTSKYLPQLIQTDEHIAGFVSGRYSGTIKSNKIIDGIMIATNQRILLFQFQAVYASMAEINYDMLINFKKITSGKFSIIKLQTAQYIYQLSFARPHSVQIFTNYLLSKT
jgi:hypothetical protein